MFKGTFINEDIKNLFEMLKKNIKYTNILQEKLRK